MKALLLMRHAKSSWKEDSLADQDRPLTRRGKADAKRMAELLLAESLVPALILSSTARRARETTEIVGEHISYGGDVCFYNALYQSSPDQYLTILTRLASPSSPVLVVGHKPEIGLFLQAICGTYKDMSTASLANVKLNLSSWAELGKPQPGKLVAFWDPKELR